MEPGLAPFRPYDPRVSADTFGGLIAKGIDKFGQETSQVGERWGQIQVDYTLNNALKEGDKITEDYGNLRGGDAQEQRQSTEERLDEIRSRAVQGFYRVNNR